MRYFLIIVAKLDMLCFNISRVSITSVPKYLIMEVKGAHYYTHDRTFSFSLPYNSPCTPKLPLAVNRPFDATMSLFAFCHLPCY